MAVSTVFMNSTVYVNNIVYVNSTVYVNNTEYMNSIISPKYEPSALIPLVVRGSVIKPTSTEARKNNCLFNN